MTNIHFLTLLMVNSFLSQLQVSLLIYAALLLSMPWTTVMLKLQAKKKHIRIFKLQANIIFLKHYKAMIWLSSTCKELPAILTSQPCTFSPGSDFRMFG